MERMTSRGPLFEAGKMLRKWRMRGKEERSLLWAGPAGCHPGRQKGGQNSVSPVGMQPVSVNPSAKAAGLEGSYSMCACSFSGCN